MHFIFQKKDHFLAKEQNYLNLNLEEDTNLFYSRTINDPSIVGKYTGKIGRTYGLSARDETSPLILPFEETSSVVQMGKVLLI